MHEDTSDGPVDPRDVERDERLTEAVRSGTPPEWFSAYGRLARYRAEIADVPQDPATTALPHVAYDDPRHNPIAFLPADETPAGRVNYAGHSDWAWPPRDPDPDVAAGVEADAALGAAETERAWCENRDPSVLTDADGHD